MRIQCQQTDIFPTRIWMFELAELAPHFAAWRAGVERLRLATPRAAGRSNHKGWNSAVTLFSDPQFAPLLDACRSAFNHAFRQMSENARFSYQFQAWANVNDRGGYNAFHIHGNTLLSGSFYLTVPPGAGELIFRDPRPGVGFSHFEGDGANASKTIRIAPREGLLVVFPNWLEHAVETHEGEIPRVSIGINAVTEPLSTAVHA